MADLPTQSDFEDFTAWSGRDVLARDGERLGAVEVIFLDESTDRPEWVLVQLEEGDGNAFIPLSGATVEERSIRVEHDRERVAGAPRIDTDDTLSVADERRLYDHYGLAYSREASSTVLPEGAGEEDSGAASTEPASTEERPRLRRYVGAPVPAATSSEEDAPAPEPTPAPTTTGTGAATPTPAPIPPPAPQVVPPEGGFQGDDAGAKGATGPLARLKRRPAVPAVIAGAIAGLIAVLALRRRR